MKAKTILPVFLILSAAACSCDFHATRTLIGYGEVEDEVIETDPFSGVNVIGSCNVEVSTGDDQSVVISAQPQIHEALSFEVSNDILHIGVKPGYKIHTDEEIRATITVPSFQFAGISGKGEFYLSGATQERLDIHISGVGDVYAYGMEVEHCNIHINGVGNCKVDVRTSLQVILSGTGSVHYRGNPEVESHITGAGLVQQAD